MQEMKQLSHLARKKLKTMDDESVLRIKTGGQPLLFAKISKARKLSKGARKSLLKRRGQQMGKIRKHVSGNIESSNVQEWN